MVEIVTSALQGKKITFTSKSPNDTTVWRGTVEAVGGINFARSIYNPIPYNAAVRKVDPTIGEVEDLTYFLITLDNNSSEVQTRIFANEWIASNSLTVIDEVAEITIKVYDSENNPAKILALLKAANYKAVLIP